MQIPASKVLPIPVASRLICIRSPRGGGNLRTRIESRLILKKLSKLVTSLVAALWNIIFLDRFGKATVALQKRDLDLPMAVDLLNP
ncbi:hypothetical protein HPB48_004600 [Haemaphysalis longicornis]|uniref:Uncharacterized protein n=1 Tax=Haemaphysalis longicornis TaxID=44386 RepID=A0A9J6FTR5_HAELO|nr:hypothetical protein HPB48_004600 [Haemaphysalis longicornis]